MAGIFIKCYWALIDIILTYWPTIILFHDYSLTIIFSPVLTNPVGTLLKFDVKINWLSPILR